jgi:hypothetical protein
VGEQPKANEPLREFFLEGFGTDELRSLGALLGVSPFIDWKNASRAEIATEFTLELQRRGLINQELFVVLAKLRPRRARELQMLRRIYAARDDKTHVAIIHAAGRDVPDRELALSLAAALRAEGLSTWMDTEDSELGTPQYSELFWGIEQASAIIVIVTPESNWGHDVVLNYPAGTLNAVLHTRHDAIPIIPVLIGDVAPSSLPPELRRYEGLRLNDQKSFERLVKGLRPSTSTTVATVASDKTVPPVLDLGIRFLEAAGREVQPVEPFLLKVPEPVLLAATTPPTSFDVAVLEGAITEREVSYFLHDGPLPEPVSQQLDGLRIRGNPVVTITADTMRAALQDGNAPAVFAEHTRLGTAGVNLFEATNAIANPSLFFGRTELLNQVGGALGRGDAVLVTGVRKAGKSSFLHMLRQAMSARPVTWIDLQRLSRADRLWPDRAFARILDAWDRWGRDTWPDAWPFTHSAKKTGKAMFVDGMEARREHQKTLASDAAVLVVLDELERMIPSEGSVEEAESFEQFAGALRSLAQASDRCVTVLAADLRPEANRRNLLPNQHTNPWFSFFVEVPLPPLTGAEVQDMVTRLAARMGVTSVDERFAVELHAFTGGHAYLTRLLAGAAWSGRQRRDRIASADLHAGLRQLEKEATLRRFYEENLWAPLLNAERQALIEMLPKPWWRTLFSRGRRDSNASASLRAQGLVSDSGITIAGFAAWLQGLSSAELHLATRGVTA